MHSARDARPWVQFGVFRLGTARAIYLLSKNTGTCRTGVGSSSVWVPVAYCGTQQPEGIGPTTDIWTTGQLRNVYIASRDCSVGMATGRGLGSREIWVRSAIGASECFRNPGYM
jgi:hypothetical protein